MKGFLVRGVDWDLRARAVVGAWGRYSPLDGRLERAFIRRKPSLFGFGKTLAGRSEHLAHRAVLHFFEGGYVGLSRVEGGLVNLAALPPRGALVVVGALKLVDGSGTPARVFALLPD